MTRRLLVVALLLGSGRASAATYYMATAAGGGSDSNNGSSGSPWATFAHAFGAMSGGDTLIVRDGSYTDNLYNPPTGTAGAYTHVQAENIGGATITAPSDSTYTMRLDGSYIDISGFELHAHSTAAEANATVIDGHHLKIRNCGVSHVGQQGNVSAMDIGPGADHILVEDCWIWGTGRYNLLAYQSTNIVVRRTVARHDFHTPAPDAGKQSACFAFYDTGNWSLQNGICIDSDPGAIYSDGIGTVNGHMVGAVHVEDNPNTYDNTGSILGTIFLNMGDPTCPGDLEDIRIKPCSNAGDTNCPGASYPYPTRYVENTVSWHNPSGAYLSADGGQTHSSVQHNHVTIGDVYGSTGDIMPAGGVGWLADISFNTYLLNPQITNSIIQGATSAGVGGRSAVGSTMPLSDYNYFWSNGTDYGNIHGNGVPSAGAHDSHTNPGLRYIVSTQDATGPHGTASDGLDRGANIIYRYGVDGTQYGETGWNTLTANPLWPWPNEAKIKSDMAAWAGGAGGSAEPGPSGARGFAAPGTGLYGGPITLTSYIWEYLGNACPNSICSGVSLTGISVAPSTASINSGSTQQFTCTATFSDSSTASCTSSAAWTSNATSVASVGASTGLATGVGPGTATIQAAYGGFTATGSLTVSGSITLSSVSVSCPSPIVVGDPSVCSATAHWSNSTASDVTSSSAWTSSATSVATIGAATGIATGVSAGSTTIQATYSGQSGTTTLSVQAAPTGTTWHVGPTRTGGTGAHEATSLTPLRGLLSPGDLVLVDYATYSGGFVISDSGTALAPITVRGVSSGSNRPVMSGGANALETRASYVDVDNLEITGGTTRGWYAHGDHVSLSNSLVHGNVNGVMGAGAGTGSVLMDHDELYANGSGTLNHQIYMATDLLSFPGSVFRMQFCYLHDGAAGNNIKSRAQRNEIYYNWIEGAGYRELELIGVDPSDNPPIAPPTGPCPDSRQATTSSYCNDSDVVGNVLRKTGSNANFYVARLGGDGTGASWGRYRFVNNTILVADGSAPGRAVFQLFDGLESLEAHNNAIYDYNGGGAYIASVENSGSPASPAVVQAGTNNWIPTGSLGTVGAWTGTVTGTTPGFANLAGYDLTPTSGATLRDAGGSAPIFASHVFQSPMWPPAYVPPAHAVAASVARPASGTIDIGAYEYAAASLSSVSVACPSPIEISGTSSCVATAHWSDSTTTTVTSSSSWTSSATAVATVGASTGVAIGVASGSTTIQATYSGQSGTASLVVSAPLPVVSTTTHGIHGKGIKFR